MTRNQIIGAASSVCLLPNFILTVIPTAAHDLGLAACMAIAVVALPLVPFAIRRCSDLSSRAMLVVLGLILLLYNFSNALDALNRGHAAATGPARGRIADAAALREKISELDVRKRQVAPHKTVSRESALAAQAARDAECKTGYGVKCRAREDDLAAAQRDRALTERGERLETELDQAKEDLRKLGPVESTADQTASQLASLAGLLWSGADKLGDAISTNRPVFRAAVVELMGGLGPWVLMLIFGAAAAIPAPKPAAKPKPRKGQAPASKDSVLTWFGERIIPNGRSVRAGVAFGNYEAWCKANGLASVNLKLFGEVMRDELSVKKRGSGTRTFYAGIELQPDLKAVDEPLPQPCKTAVKSTGRTEKRGRATAAAALPSS
jgi:hypothetical protein